MRLALVPRTSEFYDRFARAGENALETALLARRRFAGVPSSDVRQAEVKELEHTGDRLTQEILELLNTQYVTPFDREDIYALAKAIDDVVDHIEHASDLLGVYKIEAPMEHANAQCDVLVAAAEKLSGALSALRGVRRARPYLAEVKRLEDEGDRIVRAALAALFEEDDLHKIVRWKDIFDALEDAIDACETAMNVVGNIVLKNA